MPRSKGRSGRPWLRRRKWIIDNSDGSCILCGEFVDRTLDGNHKDGPTIEHRIPIVEHGHPLDQSCRLCVDPANLGLAHRRCNLEKEHTRREQLHLNTGRSW